MNPLTRISFEVPGEPVAKERPRTNMATGVVYTPAKTKNYEETVKWCYQMAAHGARFPDNELQGYGAKYEITDGGRFVECTISAMHIEDIKEQAESWVCGVERVPTEEKAALAGKDDDAVDAEFHEVEENSENCAADNNPGKEAEDSDEAPEE